MPDKDPDEDTLIECRACGGHWKINGADGTEMICRWCTQGLMTSKQEAYWRAHRSGPRKIDIDG